MGKSALLLGKKSALLKSEETGLELASEFCNWLISIKAAKKHYSKIEEQY